jgi:hypothetical protein
MSLPDIREADFDRAIGDFVTKAGRRLPIRRADLGTFQLAQEVAEQPGNLGLQLACLKRIMPDATDEELRGLTVPVMQRIIERSLANLDEVQRLLGESLGASPVSGTTASSPDTPLDSSVIGSLPPTG